jgi:hypothetical protein
VFKDGKQTLGFKRVQFVRHVQDCMPQEPGIGIQPYGLDLEPAFVAAELDSSR